MTQSVRPVTQKILDIECLRAVAIVYTLMAHCQFLYHESPHWLEALMARLHFWGGVDLFFVISGFVICKTLVPQWRLLPDNSAERLRFVLKFWLRRVRRLLPAAWFWAFVSLAIVGVTQPAALGANTYDVVAAFLQVYNLHAYACSLGRAICSHAAVGVYWSLSLEEQIYTVLPVTLALVRKNVELLFVGMLAAAFAVGVLAPHLSSFVRFEAFSLGMVLALLYGRPDLHALVDEILLRPLGRLKYLATGLMLVAIPAIGKGAIVHFSYPLVAICAAVLVLLASYDQNYLGSPCVLRSAGVYLGARSYSIYLVHMPVLNLLRWISGGHGHEQSAWEQLIWPAFATATIVGLSELSFRFIEERWRFPHTNAVSKTATDMAVRAG